MKELPVTRHRLISIWWLLFWRTIVLIFAASIFVGIVVGLIEDHFVGLSSQSKVVLERSSVGILCWVGIACHIWVVRMALQKNYGDFKIQLVSNFPNSN